MKMDCTSCGTVKNKFVYFVYFLYLSIVIDMNDDSRIGYANQVYTKQLISVLVEPLYNAVMDIYKRESNLAQNKNNVLIEFQKRLKDIPNWNQNIINENVQKASSNCQFLEDLLAAVYFSNVKILSSVKIKKSKKKVHIKLPELDSFIHQTLIEAAKRIYSNPSTFSIKIHGNDMNNKDVVYPLINEAIQEAIVKSLPFQNILQTYFGDKLHGGESSSDEEPDSDNYDDDDSDNEKEETYNDDNLKENTIGDADMFPDPESHTAQEGQGNTFFDRPEEPEPPEVKDVPIQAPGGPQQNPMEKQNPVFFKDAADDPVEEQ